MLLRKLKWGATPHEHFKYTSILYSPKNIAAPKSNDPIQTLNIIMIKTFTKRVCKLMNTVYNQN